MAPAEELTLLGIPFPPSEQSKRSRPVLQLLIPKTIELGYAKLARFRMLKSSALNCNVYRSLIWNFLKNEVSTSTKPGPRNDPRAIYVAVQGRALQHPE